MTKLQKMLLTIAISLTLVVLVSRGGMSFGEAPSGLQATVATSTLAYPVGTSATLLFATSTCSSRVITTRDVAVSLSFNESAGQVPTAIAGHVQTASTTVVYDSGQFGCGAVRAISTTVGATTVHVSETR